MLNNQIGAKPASTSSLLKASLVIILFALLFIAFVPVKAQSVVKVSDKVLKDTTIANKSYKLYLGSRGGKYVLRVSKSGNTYKQYIKTK